MKGRLSRRLSPAAKKAVLLSPPESTVRALVEVASGDDPGELQSRFEAAGATRTRWAEGSRLLTLEAPAGRLQTLADLEGVVYLDLAATFRPDEEARPRSPPERDAEIPEGPIR
ncbi:MAG: hypothetical protein KDD47_02360 [Acidobacteria bacterium]|nr:hypothetical protein [Acidobacteriota bacterium]